MPISMTPGEFWFCICFGMTTVAVCVWVAATAYRRCPRCKAVYPAGADMYWGEIVMCSKCGMDFYHK